MTINPSQNTALSSKIVRVASRHALLVLLALLASASVGCGSSTQPFIWASTHPSLSIPPPPHQLGPGDTISVFVVAQQELSGEHRISPEGTLVQPLLGAVDASGLTTMQLTNFLAQRLSVYVSEPQVTVSLVAARELRITALGEVRAPGQFLVPPDESVLGVLGRASGLSEFADDTSIYVVRRSPTAERIRFRYQNLVQPDSTVKFRLRDGDSIVVE